MHGLFPRMSDFEAALCGSMALLMQHCEVFIYNTDYPLCRATWAKNVSFALPSPLFPPTSPKGHRDDENAIAVSCMNTKQLHGAPHLVCSIVNVKPI